MNKHHNLGLPIAFLIQANVLAIKGKAQKYIEETYQAVLEELQVECADFEVLQALLIASEG